MSLKPKYLFLKLKTPLLLVGRVLSYLTPILLIQPTYAVPKWLEDFGNNLAGKSIDIVARATTEVAVAILGGLFSLIFKLGEFIIEKVILTSQGQLLRSEQIAQAWDIMLSATNVLLFLALGIMSVMIVTGMQGYNVKKALTALIYAVFIANLSKDIVLLIVDLGDALTDGVRTSFQAIGGSIDPIQLWQNGMTSMFRPVEATDWKEGVNAALTTSIVAFTTLSILAVGAYSMLKVAAVLIERIVRLALSIVFAPLIFILQLFPGAGLDGLAKNWWSDLFKWTLILPTVYFLLGLAGIMMPKNDFTMAPSILNALGFEVEQSVGTSVTPEDFILNLLLAIIAIALTLSAGNAASLLQLKPSTAGALLKPVDSFVGKAKDFGLNTLAAARNRNINAAAEGKFLSSALPLPRKASDFINRTLLGKGINALAKPIGVVAKSAQTGVDRINRLAKENKEAIGKQSQERLSDSDKARLLKLGVEINGLAFRHYQLDGGKLDKNNFLMDDALRKTHREAILKARPSLDAEYKDVSKKVGGAANDKADESIKNGMDVSTALEKLESALKKNKSGDIDQFTRVLMKQLRSANEDERRDAAEALRKVASNPENAAKIINILPDFKLPSPPAPSSKTTAEDLSALSQSRNDLETAQNNLVNINKSSKLDVTLKDALDRATPESLDKLIVNRDSNGELIEAIAQATNTPEQISRIDELVRKISGLSVEKQSQIQSQIDEAGKIKDDTTRNSRIEQAIRSSGIETEGLDGAISSVANIAGRNLSIKSIPSAHRLVQQTGTPSTPIINDMSSIREYAQASTRTSAAASRVKDLEDEILTKTSAGRGVILNALSKNEPMTDQLNDFDSIYQEALGHIQMSGVVSEPDLQQKPILSMLEKAKGSTKLSSDQKKQVDEIRTRLKDRMQKFASINHSFISPGSYNAQQAVEQATATDIATAAYAIRYKNKARSGDKRK